MAERIDIGALTSGQRSYTPYSKLLEKMFDPGTVYGGFKNDRGQPEYYDANSLIKRGSKETGITAWEDLFGNNGRGKVLDPDALLRSLNVGSALSKYPMNEQGFQRDYGQPDMSGPIKPPGGMPSQFPMIPDNQAQMGAQQEQIHNADLRGWLQSLTDKRNSKAYDPSGLRYQSYVLAPGVDLRNSSLGDLDAWAMDKYGVDLMTLAGSSPELLDYRQSALADPSMIFDPNNPSVLKIDSIPGMNPADAGARLSAYQQAVQNMIATSTQGDIQGASQQVTGMFGRNEESSRTAYGQYATSLLQQMQGAEQAAAAAPPPTFDYSYLLAQGLQPFANRRAMSMTGMSL